MNLLNKISDRSATVGVIGLGTWDFPLFSSSGKQGSLLSGLTRTREDQNSWTTAKPILSTSLPRRIQEAKKKREFQGYDGFFSAQRRGTASLSAYRRRVNKHREPDLSYVFNTTETIASISERASSSCLNPRRIGTTDEDMRRILEATGLKAGKDFYLAFSPEREDPNNKEFSTSTIPKIVGGYTKDCLTVADALYSAVVQKTVPVSSTRVRRVRETDGEYLSGREHRSGERDEDALRQDGDRHLGSDRGGQDKALRLPGVLSRARPRGPLHPHRSLLPYLEGAGL